MYVYRSFLFVSLFVFVIALTACNEPAVATIPPSARRPNATPLLVTPLPSPTQPRPVESTPAATDTPAPTATPSIARPRTVYLPWVQLSAR